MKHQIALATFCGALCALAAHPSSLGAQAPPGPLPAPPASRLPPPRPVAAKPKAPVIPPRTTLDGPWKLNSDESDNPRTKIQDSRGTSANSGGGRGGGGYPGGGYPGGVGFPGGGYPGGGGYPRGGNGPSGGSGRETENDERLEDLIRPPTALTFALKGPEIDATDDSYHKLAFFTDGRQLQKPKDDSYQEIAAHWDGSRLVSDEKTPQGAKMSRTFELSGDGRQFFETVHVDRGKSKGLLVIRYVYDVAGSGRPEEQEADPNKPVLRRHADASDSSTNPQGAQSTQNAQGTQTSQGTQSQGTQSQGTQGAQTSQDPDPDQPTLRRRADNSGSPAQ